MENNKAQDFTNDLSNWMGNLPSELRDMPIIHLAIPGTIKYLKITIINY